MKRSEKGSALPLALLVLLLVSVLGVTLFSLGMTEVAIGTNWRAYSAAFYAAEAGVESGVVALRTLLAKTPNPSDPDLNAISGLGNAPTFLETKNITFTAFSITRVLAAPSSYATTFTTGPYTGLSGIVTDYRVAAQVQGEGGTKASLTQIVKYVQIPLFQFGVFYGKGVDLEIAPGPRMDFNGRVHANSDLYMVAGGAAPNGLNFDSYITAAGKVYRRLKRDDPPVRGNNPQIKDANGNYQSLNFDHEYQPGFASKWASEQDWKAKAESVFGPSPKESTLKDSTMGVGQITPPVPDLFNNPSNPDVVAHQMIEMPKAGDSPELASAKLYSEAGLRIIDGVATDQNGGAVSLPAGSVTTKSFYDAREQKTVDVIEVDIGKLSPAKPANGVVYVASTVAPTGATMPGVRLVNGSSLPSDGLTVVSQNPVYVKGDYNTALTGPGGANHPPAAILADAVTVLSGSWDDTKGALTANKRVATSTTVNAAFATGPSAESTVGQGNGQLENDIRFLEDWSSKTLTYSGSIIDLWHSQQATAPWRCCVSNSNPYYYYSPPNRNWGYDTLFSTTPPPGTPMGVIMMKGQWTQQ
ncbi:MAG: PilX N-terminal domain-containing pilus assembly protein [Candidatus Rokuibacteriota bacterium]